MNVVKVKSGDSFAIINRSDYRDGEHELYEGETLEGGSAQDLANEIETRRQLEANRGVVNGGGLSEVVRNTSGTFPTPTPTDVRYPNKNETEFENNHGAFIGKSAPQLRAENGLEDAPGGINPDAEKARKEAGTGADDVPAPKSAAVQATEHQPNVGDTGGTSGSGDSDGEVAIPDDWQSLPWPQKRSLAAKFSGSPITNGDQADKAIEAEVERRKG